MGFSVPERAGSNPATDTNTVLYTSTGACSALVSVVNMSTSASMTYRIAHTRGSTTVDDTMYHSFDFSLLPNEDRMHGPMFMANSDSIVVRANSTLASFVFEGLSTA